MLLPISTSFFPRFSLFSFSLSCVPCCFRFFLAGFYDKFLFRSTFFRISVPFTLVDGFISFFWLGSLWSSRFTCPFSAFLFRRAVYLSGGRVPWCSAAYFYAKPSRASVSFSHSSLSGYWVQHLAKAVEALRNSWFLWPSYGPCWDGHPVRELRRKVELSVAARGVVGDVVSRKGCTDCLRAGHFCLDESCGWLWLFVKRRLWARKHHFEMRLWLSHRLLVGWHDVKLFSIMPVAPVCFCLVLSLW